MADQYRAVPITPQTEQGLFPAVPEQEQLTDEQPPAEEGGSKWDWVGSDKRPEAAEHSDGISDLLEVNEGDFDETEGVDDLVDVDFERDILDANENGDIEDLVNVSMEDVMGSAPRPRQPQYRRVAPRRTRRYGEQPPPSMRGLR